MLRPSFRAPPRLSTRTVPQPQAVVSPGYNQMLERY
jgi:hypothetical protein